MIIVMLGKLRSGKSESTNRMIETLQENGIKIKRKPLAAPIYKEAEDFYKRHGLTWRKNRRLMEGIGEALNEDYPRGDKIVELYEEDFDPRENIIVEDCRRLTQTSFFERHNAIFVRVDASDATRKARCKPGEWAEGHVTDTELDGYTVDFTIDNNSNDIGRLQDQISEIVNQIKAAQA